MHDTSYVTDSMLVEDAESGGRLSRRERANSSLALEARDVARRFGRHWALAHLDLEIEPGELVVLAGPNGSGKTTFLRLVNCLTGFVRPSSGRVFYRERDITRMAPHKIADLGLTRTFQIMRPYSSLAAFRNLVIPLSSPRARRLGGWRGGGRHGDRDTVALDLLEELGFERDSRVPRQLAGTLPTGYLKRLELGRCLALRPEVIVCDEIFSGLSLSEVTSLLPLIERLSERGITLIMIEHRLRELFQVANRVIALAEGRLIAEGEPASILDHPAVREAYLGSDDTTDSVTR